MIVPASNPLCFYCEGCLRRLRNTTCSRSRDTNACRRRITYASMALPCTHSFIIAVSRQFGRSLSFPSFKFLHFLFFSLLFVSLPSRFERRYFAAGIYHAFKYISRGHKFSSFSSFSSNQVREKMVPRLIYSFHKRCAQKIGVKEIP